MTSKSEPKVESTSFEAMSEQQLVAAAKVDAQALSCLYRQQYPAMYAHVYRRIGNVHDTNDIVADTFLAMVRYLPKYRWTGAPFYCWLLRLATTQINRWVRKRKWMRWLRLEDSTPIAAQPEDASIERIEMIRTAILELPIHYQNVVALYYLEELDTETISRILNCQVGTVKSRLARGRECLRRSLSKQTGVIPHASESNGTLPGGIEIEFVPSSNRQ